MKKFNHEPTRTTRTTKKYGQKVRVVSGKNLAINLILPMVCLWLIFLSPRLSAFTLDETMQALSQAPGIAGLHVEFRWDPFLQTGAFHLGGHYANFLLGAGPGETGYLLLDGSLVFSVLLPYVENGNLFFPETFAASLKNAFSHAIEEALSRYRIAAVIVDPGHGGKDPGAVSNEEYKINGKLTKVQEKDVVLEVSKRLSAILKSAFPDKRILMTRDKDVYPTLKERTLQANSVPIRDNEAIIYISIHANKAFNKNARGYEVWYLDPDTRRNLLDPAKYSDSSDILPILNDMLQEEFTTESILIGKSILRTLGEVFGPSVPSRGLKAGGWEVVKGSRMPAVLVELGFLSNGDDVGQMTTEEGLQKYTEALYKGITEFIGTFERSGGFTAVQ